jgi:ferric-dicitrate binding protein FerR (iron transport regulator)
MLIFNKTPLSKIVEQLENTYDISIVIDNAKLKNQTISGSFRDQSIDSILHAICLTLNIEFEKKNNSYILSVL